MNKDAAPNTRDRTLADVLVQIPTGAETIIRGLEHSVKEARLAFRGLRDYIDQNVSELTLTLKPGDELNWVAGRTPKQGRWPNCTSVVIQTTYWGLVGNGDEAHAPDAASLAALPLLVLGSDARHRITRLVFSDSWRRATVSESAIVNFALLLPNLQELDLEKAYGMTFQPHAQQLLYEGLATLQHLNLLNLPSCRALPRVGALAGNLTRLSVLGVNDFPDNGNADDAVAHRLLDASGIAAIAQLRLLRELELEWDWASAAEEDLLPLLLESLPTTLQKLGIPAPEAGSFEATIQSGRIRDLRLPYLGNAEVVCSLAQALLSSRAVGPQLQSMVIGWICAGEWLKDPGLQPLWELMRRCGRVEVQEISFPGEVVAPASAAAEVAEVEDAVRRLGRPRQVSYWSFGGNIYIRLKLPALAGRPTAAGMLGAPGTVGAPQQLADAVSALHAGSSKQLGDSTSSGDSGGRQQSDPASGSAAGSNSSAQPPPPLPIPSAAEVAEAVLQRMISGTPVGALVRLVTGAGAEAIPTAADGPAAGAERHSAAAADARQPSFLPAARLVLLRGPLVASLLPAPELLTSWVRWLDERAVARLAATGADQGGAGELGNMCIERYRVLPTVLERPGVLLRCGGSGGRRATGDTAAAAVVAAAREVGAAKGAEGALEAVQMALATISRDGGRGGYFRTALRQEVEALWEHLVPRCGGDLEAELGLMRQLLELWEELVEMPEEVHV